MASRINFRRLDGILLLDKPTGMSSNAALQIARRLYRAEKGGHTGSLDPLATGLLPLCFGEPAISAAELEAALAPLKGRILQRAPIYSALKQGGEPLYVKARRGDVIEAPEREVHVHAIEVLDQQPGRLRLRVTCGSGTYIRSLARDLGETLGCGAHIAGLRRLWVDPFRDAPMVTLDTLRALADQGDEAGMEALLLPLGAGLADYPRVTLGDEQARRFCVGQRLRNADWAQGVVAVYGPDEAIQGLGQVDETGLLAPQRRFNF
jgi:tRNA pseudouridine55 synthase